MKNGKQAEHFFCPTCDADHVKADEDWCCSMCGSECFVLPCSCPPAVTECKESGRCGAFVSSVCVPGFPCFETEAEDSKLFGEIPKPQRLEILRELVKVMRADERQKTLQDVRDMLFLEHRKELGMIVGGTETERAVTKIFAQFIKRVEAME